MTGKRKARPTEQRWPGGYIRQGLKGPVFVIERRVYGQHFHISTRCHTLRAALVHLERFEMDPAGYDPRGEQGGRLVMTADLILKYRDWQLARKVSKDWCDSVERHLDHWQIDLCGKDLRRLTLTDVKTALAKRGASLRNRAVAFKGFCHWLRSEQGLLEHNQDVSLNLRLPPQTPAKLDRARAVPQKHIDAVRPYLPEYVRDCLDFLSVTGWHVAELRRFACGEGFLRLRLEHLEGPEVLAVAVVKHKSGRVHATVLRDQLAVDAAKRLLLKAHVPSNFVLGHHMHNACNKAVVDDDVVPFFGLGRLRHTVATRAYEQGVPIEQVSRFLGHRTPVTTSDYYVDTPKAPEGIPVLKLVQG